MKTIGNIFLSWRKERGSRRILVGIIKYNTSQGVRFEYLPVGIKDAKKYGFSTYEGFPDTSKTYTENVLRIFGQRIMRTDRYDIDDFLDFWQIDKEQRTNPLYMLAYTQGLQPTDNFEFLAAFNPIKGLSFVSEICGLSHHSIPVDSLTVGDKLIAIREPSNNLDPNAVRLFKGDQFLGYVKLIHNRVFSVTNNLSVTVHKVEQNGKVNRVFIKIRN